MTSTAVLLCFALVETPNKKVFFSQPVTYSKTQGENMNSAFSNNKNTQKERLSHGQQWVFYKGAGTDLQHIGKES